jgi:hypothetical protein
MITFKPLIYRHWQDWADLLLGLAVLLSPWLLGFIDAPAPMWNAVMVGAAIMALSAFAIARLEPWEEWLNIALGLWLIVSSWLLDYSVAHQAVAAHVGLGLLITLMAASELWEESQGRATPDSPSDGTGKQRYRM